MGVLEQWNRTVDQHWDYWEYYKDLYDYSLSKGASTLLTGFLYPVLYQERLVKREFVNNMQLLGELTPAEIEEFSKLRHSRFLNQTYIYHAKPSGKFPTVLFPPALITTAFIALYVPFATKSISWYFMAPILTFVTSQMVGTQIYKLKIPELVDCTHWALQKRKAEVWLEEKKHPTSKIASLPQLKKQVLKIVKENKP